MRLVPLLLLVSLTACVSTPYQKPLMDEPTAAARTQATPAPWGLVGLTATFDLASLSVNAPTVTFTLRHVETGTTSVLKIDQADMKKYLSGGEGANAPHAILFPVAVGRYEMVDSVMAAPGGSYGGKDFSGLERQLDIQRYLRAFDVRAGKLTHLTNVTFTLKDAVKGHTRTYSFYTTVATTKPPKAAWQAWRSRLAGATYLKLTSKDTYIVRPLSFKEDDGMTAAAEIQKVTRAVDKDVRACQKQHNKSFRGKVEIKYAITPEGSVDEPQVTSTATSGKSAGAMDKCITDLYKALKFPPTPSDDYENWTSSWEF